MNGPILTKFQKLKYVPSLAAEVEMGTIHNNGKAAIPIRVALDEMVHTKGPTSLNTDTNTAEGLVNNTIRNKKNPRPSHAVLLDDRTD